MVKTPSSSCDDPDSDPVPYVLSIDRAGGRGSARIERFLPRTCPIKKDKPMWVAEAVPPAVLRDDLLG